MLHTTYLVNNLLHFLFMCLLNKRFADTFVVLLCAGNMFYAVVCENVALCC